MCANAREEAQQKTHEFCTEITTTPQLTANWIFTRISRDLNFFSLAPKTCALNQFKIWFRMKRKTENIELNSEILLISAVMYSGGFSIYLTSTKRKKAFMEISTTTKWTRISSSLIYARWYFSVLIGDPFCRVLRHVYTFEISQFKGSKFLSDLKLSSDFTARAMILIANNEVIFSFPQLLNLLLLKPIEREYGSSCMAYARTSQRRIMRCLFMLVFCNLLPLMYDSEKRSVLVSCLRLINLVILIYSRVQACT